MAMMSTQSDANDDIDDDDGDEDVDDGSYFDSKSNVL